ncbi:hypothetical protein E4T80_09865 [Muribacter muris]|uniref:Uncharacterized protein n=1 Tax=Muribacter muris TaxID=67855 RepID=A0A4Y9JVW1_9PAST|nr:hypothetical protein [Muribacter muris]MBF0785764.1 hypothetical protein [Muribacter muris]MBF0828264.1 hypothetical protein [Muribacter muris]TFV08586.1 hypothetical protein E4T80_09865 [Muribacter muris]
MSCQPNVITIVNLQSADVSGFSVSKAVRVTAFGLSGKDTVTFRRVQYCSKQPNYMRDGCCLFVPEPAHLSSAVDYQIGECNPSLTLKRNTIIMPYAGSYIPVVNGSESADLVVQVEPVDGTHFDDKEKGIEPCGVCLDETWETTGAERCNQHFVEQEEISNCGNVRWTRTAKRCGYYASVPLPITLDDEACCGSQFMGYLFHPSEPRDPDATVEIRDCEGVLHGYAYPQAGDGHTLPIQECGGDIVGYAVNNSATAPQLLTGCKNGS